MKLSSRISAEIPWKEAVWTDSFSLVESKALIHSIPNLNSIEPLQKDNTEFRFQYLYQWLLWSSSWSNDGFPGRLHFDLSLKCLYSTVLMPHMTQWMPWVKYLQNIIKQKIHGAFHAANDSLVHFLNTLTKGLMCIRENCMLNRNMKIHIWN